MYEVGVVDHFEAAHRLRGDFGPATRQHGHTYRVDVAVRGASLRSDGTLFDIGRLREAVRAEVGALHDRDLNELPAFKERNSTAEEVAGYLAGHLKTTLAGSGIEAISVQVWESPEAFASCRLLLAPGSAGQ